MTPLRRRILLNILKLFDLVLMLGSFLAVTFVVSRASAAVSFTAFLSMRVRIVNLFLSLILLALWHMVFCAAGLYKSRRMSGRTSDTVDTLKATVAGVLLIALATSIFTFEWSRPSSYFCSG